MTAPWSAAPPPARPRGRRRPAVRGGDRADRAPLPLAELAAVAALTAAAGLFWSSTFSGGLLLPAILGAAVLHPALVAATGRGLLARRSARMAVGFEGAAVALAIVLGGATAALRSLQRGWGDLLTTSLPVDTGSRTFGLALVVTWAAGFAASELVLSRRRTLAPLLPPVVATAVALAVGAPGRDVPLVVPAAMILAGGILVALRAGARATSEDRRMAEESGLLAGPPMARLPGVEPVTPPRHRSSPLRLLAGAGVASLAAALAVFAGPALPGVGSRDRFDVRRYRSDPVVEREAPNPLLTYAALIREPDRTVAAVRGGSPDVRLRLATLDAFDGSTWTSTARFTRASTTLPEEPDLAVPTGEVTLDIEVADLDTAYLPAPDRPVRVDREGLGIDAATGVLVAPDAVARGRRYQVTSAIPQRTAAGLRAARQATRTGDAPPGLPDDLRRLAETVTAGAATSFGKPAALLRYFEDPANGFTISTTDPPGGHGYFAISKLFEPPRPGRYEQTRTGSDEQYASAIAVLSRAVGYESRVVVGFRMPVPDPDGVARVQGSDARAWAEVRFEGQGWVPFEPAPIAGPGRRSTTTPTTVEPAPGAPAPPAPQTNPVQEAVPLAPDDTAGPNGTAPRVGGDGGRSLIGTVALLIGALVLLSLAAVAALVGTKAARRRRRRQATDPKAAVLGAWADALDRLVEHGGSVKPSMSAAEVVAGAEPAAAGPLAGLARLANAARFDADGPSPEQASSAWSAADAVRSALRTTAGPAARIRAALSPAPFLRRT